MSMTPSPCYKCPSDERHPGCHSTCKKYKEWLPIHRKEKEEVKKYMFEPSRSSASYTNMKKMTKGFKRNKS